MKTSENYKNNLQRAYAKAAVDSFEGARDTLKRVAKHAHNGKLETFECRATRRGPNHGRKTVVTQGITIEQVFDICERILSYQARSDGRLATGADKKLLRAKESRNTFARKQQAESSAARNTESYHRNKGKLVGMLATLATTDNPQARDAMIDNIHNVCNSAGMHGLPFFLSDPHTLQSETIAQAYIDTLYALFPYASRGFKKYFLKPRINQAKKLWSL